MVTKRKRLFPILSVLALLLSSFVGILSPSDVYANGVDYFSTQNKKFYSGIFLRDCLVQTKRTTISDPSNYQYLIDGNVSGSNTGVYIGRYLKQDDGWAKCQNTTLVQQAISNLGYADGSAFLAALGYQKTTQKQEEADTSCSTPIGGGCPNKIIDATVYKIGSIDTAISVINKRIGENEQTVPAKYYAHSVVFSNNCTISETISGKGVKATQTKIVEKSKDSSGKITYSTESVDVEFTPKENKSTSSNYETTTTLSQTDNYNIERYDYNGQNITCSKLLTQLNGMASVVAQYSTANNDNALSSANIASNVTKESGETGDSEAVCTGGGLGWILCPLTTLVSDSITTLATYIEGFMRFDPLIGSDQGNAILNIWRLMVRIANIILVIAFMIVIFSQATSVGLSAYGIKKILPRIIAAAILINISFYICALAVDIANILGASMQGIISGASSEIGKGTGIVDAPNFGAALIGISVPLVIAIGVASFTGAIAFILPILVSGAVSLFFLFIVLALRHVITFMLIIVSPLAFAAMVLPNTDGLFKKWWKAFYISLALYPIIMALAYGSVLVSKVILVAAPKQDPEATIWAVFGFIALFAWIWALKSIVTWGGGLLGKVAGMVNDSQKGLIDRSRNWAKEKQGRSTVSQYLKSRKASGDVVAQRRSYKRISSASSIGGTRNPLTWGKTGQYMTTQIDTAVSDIATKEMSSHASNINRAAAEILTDGRLSSDGKTYIDKNTGARLNVSSLDKVTQGALAYAQRNRLTTKDTGVQAIASKLYEFGGMNADYVQKLASMSKDKAAFMEFSAANAAKTGMGHLKFATIDNGGIVDFGGALGGGTNRVAEKLVAGGINNISKDTWSDKDPGFSQEFTTALMNQRASQPEAYEQGLAKMTSEQVGKLQEMLVRSGNPLGVALSGSLSADHQAAITKFKP